MNPVDVDSLVPVQDAPQKTEEGQAPQQTIVPPIDINSLNIDPPEQILKDNQARIALNSPTPLFQKITDFALNPVGEVTKAASEFGVEKGASDFNKIEFLPLKDDANKSRDSGIISNLTGIPQGDIEQHYDSLKTLYHAITGNPALVGEDFGKKIDPVTAQGIINAVMTPAVIAGIVAEPPLAIARLIGFTALDHALNLNQYIPKDASKSEKASLELLNMIGVGIATGGIEHGIRAIPDLATGPLFDLKGMDMSDVLEKYSYQKLQDNGLPDVITLSPDAMDKINQIDAEKRRAKRNDAKRQNIVDDLASKLIKNEPMPENVAPEIIRDAKQQVIDQIDAKEANGEKIMNREQQVRHDLKQQLAQETKPETILATLGVDPKTAETASANKLAVKLKAEKLVKVAMKSDEGVSDSDKVFAILTQDQAEKESAVSQQTKEVPQGTTETGEMKPSGEQPTTALETGSGTISGVSKGIEANAIEQKLTKEGFENKAEYGGTTVKEQSELISRLMKSDIEKAKRIATGKEVAPEGLRTEALFSVMKDYAMDTKDGKLARELAQSPVASEISAAGSKLALSGVSDPESATAKIREVMKEKEVNAEKKLKGKTPENAKAEIKKSLTEKIAKEKPSKYDLMTLLESIKC